MRLYLDSNSILWIDNKIITEKIEFIQITEKRFNIRKSTGESLLPIGTEFFDMEQFNVEKEDNSIYATTSEIKTALLNYLLISANLVTGSEIILSNATTGIKTRFIATTTGYRIDVTLTALGFDGQLSIDGGVTGDWITTASA